MPYYAVAKGKSTGIFTKWEDCQDQITGFKGALYKKFDNEEEAKTFITEKVDKVIDKREKVEEKVSDKDISGVKRSASDDNDPVESKKSKISKDKGETNFSLTPEGFLIVHTDGAYGFYGKHGAKAGIGVYFGEDNTLNASEPVTGKPTNNTAVIEAATLALKLSKSAGYEKVQVNTESQYLVNCASSWMSGWKKNDWKKRDGNIVSNKEELMQLDKECEGLVVKWHLIKSGDKTEASEAADKLAREGAKKYVAKDEKEKK